MDGNKEDSEERIDVGKKLGIRETDAALLLILPVKKKGRVC